MTSCEAPDLEKSVRVRRTTSLEPFSRDKLLLSVYDSLRHRPTAIDDATALTNTIVVALLNTQMHNACIDVEHIVTVTAKTLHNFDAAAATSYQAFHRQFPQHQ